MFYVKFPLSSDPAASADICIDLTDENVFTTCLDCGREMQVDLSELSQDSEGFDLYGTNLRCGKCSAQQRARKEV